MKYFGIGKFASLIGVTQQSLRNWDKTGRLKPHHVGKSGYRYYSQEQLYHYLGLKDDKPKNRKVIGYCRVSGSKQKDDLERQIENVKSYMCAKGYSFEVISDMGNGISYNKKGLNQLITMITSHEVEKIVILYRDRLLQFGYELIENICAQYGTTIEIIDNSEKAEEQELLEDFIQMVTAFSRKLPGKKANNAKKLIKDFLAECNCNEAMLKAN